MKVLHNQQNAVKGTLKIREKGNADTQHGSCEYKSVIMTECKLPLHHYAGNGQNSIQSTNSSPPSERQGLHHKW